jgi:hypothetical protein
MPTTKLTSTGLQFYDDDDNLISSFAFDTSTGDLSHDKGIEATQFVTSAAVVGIGVGVGGGSSSGVGSFTITVNGSGWGVNETGDFIAKTGSGSGAAFTVTSVNANTGITGLTVTSTGSGYAVNDVLYADEGEEGETRPEVRVDSLA